MLFSFYEVLASFAVSFSLASAKSLCAFGQVQTSGGSIRLPGVIAQLITTLP